MPGVGTAKDLVANSGLRSNDPAADAASVAGAGVSNPPEAGIDRTNLSGLFRGTHDIDQRHARSDNAGAPGRGAAACDARPKVKTCRTDGV